MSGAFADVAEIESCDAYTARGINVCVFFLEKKNNGRFKILES